MKPKSPAKGKGKSKPSPPADAIISFDQLRALIDLLDERGLDEFEMERAGVRIRIKRRGAAGESPVFESDVTPTVNPARVPAVETRSEEAQVEAAAEMGLLAEDVHIVKSPIVGTFYAAPRPEAPPFVKLGDVVEVGQGLCIIEAMKLMNEIEADVAGEIARIYVESTQPVEYGEPLFAIRRTQKK